MYKVFNIRKKLKERERERERWKGKERYRIKFKLKITNQKYFLYCMFSLKKLGNKLIVERLFQVKTLKQI